MKSNHFYDGLVLAVQDVIHGYLDGLEVIDVHADGNKVFVNLTSSSHTLDFDEISRRIKEKILETLEEKSGKHKVRLKTSTRRKEIQHGKVPEAEEDYWLFRKSGVIPATFDNHVSMMFEVRRAL